MIDNEAISCTNELGIVAKIRRLKIQECLLLQNLNKCFPRVNHADDPSIAINCRNVSEFKNFSVKINNSYIVAKNLFYEIKDNTNSQKMIKSFEINDVKNKILELEANIKSLKICLSAEIKSLKLSEQELSKQMHENLNDIYKIKKQPKLKTMSYNTIIPSPVRVMINSPFKCSEVQQFHEFMANSQNRYGSWNEYNHNIFVKYWQKYFETESIIDLEENISKIKSLEGFPVFLEEILRKLKRVKKEDILSHIKWYIKFIHLKDRQQKALNNWKSNKRIITQVKKISESNVQNDKTIESNFTDIGVLKDMNKQDEDSIMCNLIKSGNKSKELLPDKIISHQHLLEQKVNVPDSEIMLEPKQNEHSSQSSTGEIQNEHRLLKPTKQWISRCYSHKLPIDNCFDIGEIKKLRIPSWRLGLQE